MTDEVTQAPEAADSSPAPKWAPEVEHEARALGWKSPDEWKGEIPPTYIDDPAKYLDRASTFTPFRKLKEEHEGLKRTVEERIRKIENVAANAVQRARADAEARIAQIQAAQLKAVEVGDVDQFKALKAQEAQVVRTLAEPEPQPQQPGIDPVVKQSLDTWVSGKTWFGKGAGADPVATNAAMGAYAAAQERGLTDPVAILREVDAVLAKRFPEYYPAAQKPAEPVLEGGLTLGGGSRSTGFSKLPKDAQDAFKRFVARGLFTDDEAGRRAYVEDYNNA